MPVFQNVRKLLSCQERKKAASYQNKEDEEGSLPKVVKARGEKMMDLSQETNGTAHTREFLEGSFSNSEPSHLASEYYEKESEEEGEEASRSDWESSSQEAQDPPFQHHQQQETQQCLRVAIKNLKEHLEQTTDASVFNTMDSDELDAMVTDLESQLEFKTLEMGQVVQMLTTQLRDKEAKSKEIVSSIDTLSTDLKTTSEKLQLPQEESQALDNVVWQLEEQLQAMEEQLRQKDTIIDQLYLNGTESSRLEAVENELQVKAALLSSIEQKETTILSLTQQLEDARLQVAKDKENSEEERALQIQPLESWKIVAEDHISLISRLKVEVSDLKKELTEKTEAADQHEREVVELKKSLAEEVACKDAVISQMAKQIQTLQTELNELKKTSTRSVSTTDAMSDASGYNAQAKLQEVTQEKQELAQEWLALKWKYEDLKRDSTSQLEIMALEKEELERSLESVRSSEAFLLNEQDAMNDLCSALKVELKECKDQVEFLQVEVEEQRRKRQIRRLVAANKHVSDCVSVCSNSNTTVTTTNSAMAASYGSRKRQQRLRQYLSSQVYTP